MSDYLFPRERKTFEEAFPDLQNVTIEIAFLRGGGQEEKKETYTKDNFPGKGVNCINPICKNGGLSEMKIPRLIRKMISEKKKELNEYEFCNGGVYSRKKRYRDCGWSFKIDISLQYTED